jgi:hypothetical protein
VREISPRRRLRTWFGDLGGDAGIGDTNALLQGDLAAAVEGVLADPRFEAEFRQALEALGQGDPIAISDCRTAAGVRVRVAPGLGVAYNIAGQLATARLLGRNRVFAGSKDERIVRLLARGTIARGLRLKVILGRTLTADLLLVDELRSAGVEVDDRTCVEAFDLPESYVEEPFAGPVPGWVMPLLANSGSAPMPAIAGTMAALYGDDLLTVLDRPPAAVAAVTTDGTNALGALKAFLDSDCLLATVEGPVAQEFHIVDHGCYTLSVRRAARREPNVSLCPELVDLWRKGRVQRLGCDRLTGIDSAELQALGLGETAARAAVLAVEATAATDILIVED